MKKLLIFTILLSLGLSHTTWGEVFQVNDVGSLQTVLTTAQSNGEEDTINIGAGDFIIANTLAYTTSENFALTIAGEGPGSTNLIGADAYQILNLRTTSGVTDYNAHIKIESITLRDGYTTGNGGALSVFTNAAIVTIDNVEFLDNTASYGGAAYIIATYGNVFLYGNIFIGNESTNFYGGAVLGSMTGDVVFDKNLFQGNRASNYGGVYVVAYSGDIDFTRNTFIGNSATQLVGGLGLDASAGYIISTNNIISGNSANDVGGGIFSTDTGVVSAINNTIYNNTAQNDKGGLHLDLGSGAATANIYNNIIWGNVSLIVGDLYISDIGATTNLYNNNLVDYLVVDGTNFMDGNNINEDPLLDTDFVLQAGSPCIDAGDNNAPEIPLIDKVGNDRIMDGDLDGTADVDMGAYEYWAGGDQDIDAAPTGLDFGEINKGESSNAKIITIQNQGGGNLTVSGVTVAGDNADEFTIDFDEESSDSKGVFTVIIPAGGTKTIAVTFSPASAGEKKASVQISSDDPDEDVVIVTLNGKGKEENGGGGCFLSSSKKKHKK